MKLVILLVGVMFFSDIYSQERVVNENNISNFKFLDIEDRAGGSSEG